jgi:hypothetical protein
MNMKCMSVALSAILSVALSGCGRSEIDTVKATAVPQDANHTYDTALSNRDSCDKDSWRTFKDNSNRTVVEYRCELKNGAALLAAFRQQQIADTQRDFQGYLSGLDQTAGSIQNPEQMQKQLAEAQTHVAQLQADGTPSADTPEALKQRLVNRSSEMRAAQRELDDARSNQTGVQKERARFEQQEKDTLAQIDKTYGGVTKASEVFQWFVRNTEIAPAWTGVELEKQDGDTVRQDRRWQQTLWDLLNHRGDDHVHAVLNVPDSIVSGH